MMSGGSRIIGPRKPQFRVGLQEEENPIRYHSDQAMRSREQDYDYSPIIQLFKLATDRNYTEAQINRVVDNVEITKHAAIRGYIGIDSLT